MFSNPLTILNFFPKIKKKNKAQQKSRRNKVLILATK